VTTSEGGNGDAIGFSRDIRIDGNRGRNESTTCVWSYLIEISVTTAQVRHVR
jgi:hypothetical protein